MTKLSASAFIAKYTTIFADNGNREISAEDMRDFRQDIADSFWNQVDDALTALDKQQVDTSGATITLDMDSKSQRLFYRSEEHTSELQSRENLVCRLLLEKKK